MKNENKAIVSMHIATFLFGMTAILGKLIQLNEFNMVWHRMLLASVLFFFFPNFIQALKNTPKQVISRFLLIGIIVALHWLTFYGSIKANNSASLTLACFGSVSIFAAIFEPIILKTKFRLLELFIGFFILIGLFFIAKASPDSDFSLQSNYFKAIVLALISALLAVIFTILNKKYIANYNPLVATWAQMTGGFIFLTFLLPFVLNNGLIFDFFPDKINYLWLFLLAFICTNIAFSLEMKALKNMSAFTSSVILNLEPIYGIIAAFFIFNEREILNQWFFIGTAIILSTVFLQAYIAKKAQ